VFGRRLGDLKNVAPLGLPDESRRIRGLVWKRTGSENRCMLLKARAVTSCAGGSLARCHCFKKWTSSHPRKSHSMRGLRCYQYTRKTVAFHATKRSARSAAFRGPRGARQGQFQGQFWGQRGSRNSKPRVYLGFSMR
jgi:hypothetical protein